MKAIAQNKYQEIEAQTYNILEQTVQDLQKEKIDRLESLSQQRKQLNSLMEQINDLNKLISLKENQIEQEFILNVKQIKAQAIEHLKGQKIMIRNELQELQQ
ncbi:Hypothetical_protein [Hexamita inflata]|uniref:Hypothetical_protein n=1 Tax=Hexamita inflata TaxID=28002 RepID=A0AA86PF26_9EUKA|nr:Hypothetical protein HINF_LOCUS24942 [Hexamita inflata]